MSGRPLTRREDERALRGHGRYLDDIELPRLAHVAFVRSAHAHAEITGIRKPAGAPGLVATLTAEELGDRVRPLPVGGPEGAQLASEPHPILASGEVRYVGQPVVAVIAESRALAEDAAELVDVDYQPLEVVMNPRASELALMHWSRASGDVDGAFAAAAHVFRGSYALPRLVAAPIETRGCLIDHDPRADLLTVWCSAQDPHRPLAQLAHVLRRETSGIRVIVPDVGGAFGGKGVIAPEVGAVARAAMDLGRPLKWAEDRLENFLAAYQGRGIAGELELALDADGRMLAIRAELTADLGAYLLTTTAVPPHTAATLITGCYDIPAAHVTILGACTHKVPTGPYRGAGRPDAAYMLERLVDDAARAVGIDRIELRRRNLIRTFPYRTPMGLVYDSGDYERCLDLALELAGKGRGAGTGEDGGGGTEEDLGGRTEEDLGGGTEEGLGGGTEDGVARAGGDDRIAGVGVGLFVERAGGQWESAEVEVQSGGRVVVRSSASPHGQGHETTFAQIAAARLGIGAGEVELRFGDSAEVPPGVGTFGSRSVAMAGSAIVVAIDELIERGRGLAAQLLGAEPADVVFEEGRFKARGRTLTLAELASAAEGAERLAAGADTAPGTDGAPGADAARWTDGVPGADGALRAAARFESDRVYSSGAYFAAVEIERSTGRLHVLRLAAVDDAGNVINPVLAHGQVIGGAVQGLGECLVELAEWDADGQPRFSSLMDYSLLTAAEIPPISTGEVMTPSPLNPLGAKGIGEGGAIGTLPAVANAVVDALGGRHVDPPFSAEKLWRALSEKAG
jgi:aerobic carbon-monoxide dehydrogenase large subunit